VEKRKTGALVMTDRLKEIWGRFEKTTRRSLTSTNVDNIPRPVVEEMRRSNELGRPSSDTMASEMTADMPEELTPPAKQAFAALRTRLTGFDEKGRPERKKQAPREFVDDADAPLEQMMIDLKATEQRVVRRELDYKSWYKTQEEARQRKPRKKFLGIF
jgi:hypothetical protein